MAEKRNIPKSKFQGDLRLGGIYWKDAVRVRQNEGLNQWQKNHFRLMKMVEYQESVVQGYLERLLTRIGIEYSRKEYVPTNDEILDKLMSIDPEVQKLVLLNGKAAAMEMFVKQNYDLKGRYRNIFQGGRIPRNMSMKVINDYLDEVDAPTMEQSALEDYTSQMRSELAEITQRHIAKSVAQMTAWNWSRGRGIEELTRRFQEEQEKEDIDMSKVLPNAETVIRTESMKIMNAEAWRSATEVGSYADGLLWGFSYHAVGDSRTRETHLAQHGVCAPVDDPFWNEWTPPNGYNCRCWLISEWEEPSSYKQPRRDLHPDPGFAFNPANNVSGRVPQPKKAEPKKPEVNTQSQEPVAKPDELGKDDAASEKNFEKKGKNIQKPVTSSKKKRYNNMGESKSTVKPNAPRSLEPPFPDEQEGKIIPTSKDDKFDAVHGTMVKTTRSMKEAEKTIRDAGGTVPEDKPEIKPDNTDNRKEQENNDSKRGITKQELQDALEEFHNNNSVNSETTLIASLLPDGRLIVKKGEVVVAEISVTELSKSIISSVDGLFHAIVNGSTKVFSKLWLFFKNVSEQNDNADIVGTEEKKKIQVVKSLYNDSVSLPYNEAINVLSTLTGKSKKECQTIYKAISAYTGGRASGFKELSTPEYIEYAKVLDEYIDATSALIPILIDSEQNEKKKKRLEFYRGEPFLNFDLYNNRIAELSSSKGYTTESITSWSTGLGFPEQLRATKDLESYYLLLILEHSNRLGVIGTLSCNASETEAILKAGTILRLKKIVKRDNENHFCSLIVEEIN